MYRSQLQHVILEIGRRFDIDVIPPNDDQNLADQISFVLGEASDFDFEHGYHAQGVSSQTPTYAPADWKMRAIPVRVEQYTGWCMEPHDLVISKLGAAREKDLDFARSAAKLGLVHRAEMIDRLGKVACADEHRKRIAVLVDALFA